MDGKKIAEEKFVKLQKKIEEDSFSLSLAIVKTMKDDVSETYVNAKKKTLEKYGIRVAIYTFKEDVKEDYLQEFIKDIKEDGIIVQLPLPSQIRKENILNFIDVKKDVDVFSAKLLGDYYLKKSTIIPPVVGAVDILLKEYSIDVKGKNVALVGAGDLVGKPLTLFFIGKEATVFVLNKHTGNIENYIKEADVVVSGAGVFNLIKGEMVKEGAVVIDAGTSFFSGKVVGDVEIESVSKKASYLAKVPGGVGPLTTYCLAKNLIELKKYND